MYTIFKPVVWILLLPFNIIRWLLKTILWVVILPFRIIDFIFNAPFWFFRWLFSFLHRGQHVQVRLHVFQVKGFLARYSEGDVGTMSHLGA